MSGIATCPPKTDLEKVAEMPDGLDKTMTAMGVESCKTTANSAESNYAAGANLTVKIPLASATATVYSSGGSLETATTSVGCEQITAIARSSVDVTDRIQCTLKSSVLDSSQVGKAYNSVKFFAGGDMNLICDNGFKVDQKNQIKLSSSISFTQEQMRDVERTIIDGLKQTADIIKNTETGWGATPEGQKYIEQTQEKITKGEYDANITENMNKISQYASGTNELVFEATGNYTLRGSQCTISQDNVVELIADIVYSDCSNNVFKEFYEKTREYDTKMDQTTVSGGAPTLRPPTIPSFTDDSESSTATIIAIVVIIVVIVGAAGGYFWLNRGGDDDE